MHELSLTKPVVDLVLEHAKANHAQHVSQVTLLIGQLACAQPTAISWAFDAMTKNTLVQGAKLIIEEEPGLGQCRDCAQQFELTSLVLPCPNCQGHNIRILSGQAFMLKSIQIGY